MPREGALWVDRGPQCRRAARRACVASFRPFRWRNNLLRAMRRAGAAYAPPTTPDRPRGPARRRTRTNRLATVTYRLARNRGRPLFGVPARFRSVGAENPIVTGSWTRRDFL